MKSPMLVLCVLVLAPALWAQGNVGTVNGVVSYSGGPVAGTSVQLKNLDTGATLTAAAGLLGNYSLAQVPPGRYQMTATAFGFKPYERKDAVVVVAGQTQKVDVPMGDFISLDTLGEDRATIGRLFLTRPAPPTGPVPRLKDGKPDLSGLWYGPAPVGAAVEMPELQPWAEKIAKERVENNLRDTPSSHCLPFNVSLMSAFLNRIVHTSDFLATVIEYDIPGYRQVYLDGRAHPKDLEPSWTGHSIGTWDGDTLVIDAIGYNDKTWLGEAAPHTTQLHVTTRLRRVDLGRIEIETTYDDPGALKKPWKVKGVATLAPARDEIFDFICNENNQALGHR